MGCGDDMVHSNLVKRRLPFVNQPTVVTFLDRRRCHVLREAENILIFPDLTTNKYKFGCVLFRLEMTPFAF